MRGVKNYSQENGVVKGIKNKLANFSLAALMVLASVGGALPLFFTQTANAVGSTTVAIPSNTGGWYAQDGAPSYVAGPLGATGSGSLKLTTDVSTKQNYFHTTNTPLSGIADLGYSVYDTSGVPASYQLQVTGASGSPFTSLVWEPVYNGQINGPNGHFVSENNLESGIWWSSNPIAGAPNRSTFVSLSTIIANNPNAVITNYGVGVGSGTPNATSYVDNVSFQSNITNFEPASPAIATSLTSNTPEPGAADTCDYTAPFAVTSHVDSTNADYNKQVVVQISADTANPGPVALQWSNPAFYGGAWQTTAFTGGVANYAPTGPNGFPLHNNETTNFRVKFPTSGIYKFSSQIVLAANHGTTFGTALNTTTNVTNCSVTLPVVAAQISQIVNQADFAKTMDTWVYHNDVETNPFAAATTTANSTHQITANPTPAVGDNGAVKLDTSSGQKWNLASLQYSGTKLTDISALGFDVYTSNPGQAYINLDVDFNHTGYNPSYQGRLVYVPPSVTANTWSHQEAVASNGVWKWSNMITGTASAWPDGVTAAARSWNDIVTAFPDATITAVNDAAFGSLYLRSDGVSTTHYDHVYLATATKNVNYNFELNTPSVPTNLKLQATPSNDNVPDNGFTNSYNTKASWEDVDSASVDHYVYKYWNDIATSPYNSEVGAWTTSVNSLNYSGVFNQGEGTHRFAVSACDAVNNCSAFSSPFTVTYDKTAPTSPTISKPGARQWFKTTPISTMWSAASDSSGVDHYQVAYHYDDNHSFSGSSCLGDSISGLLLSGCRDTAGNSRNHNPALNEEGGVTIWVRAIDNAGNVGSWSQSVHYYYDHTPPSTDIVVSGLNNNIANDTFTVEGDASDNLSLNRVYVQLVNRQTGTRYGGTTINLIPNGIDPSGVNAHWSKTYDVAALGLPDGTYAANVEATDMAGNRFNPGWSTDFKIDTTAPVIVISSASKNSDKTYTISGTTDDVDSPIIVSLDSVELTGPISITGNIWSITTGILSAGNHAVTATSTDTVGNAGTATPTPFGFTVASAGPNTAGPNVPQNNAGGNARGTAPVAVVVTPTFTAFAAANPAGGTIAGTTTGTQGVLGDSTTKDETRSGSQILGDSTSGDAQNNDNTCTKFLGICWYYWIPIVIVVAGIVYYGYKRYNKDQNTTV